MRPPDPFASHRFKLEIEGIEETSALEVVFPEARIVAGSASTTAIEAATLTVRRGQTLSSTWYDWWNEGRGSAAGPDRTVVVVLLDGAGVDAMRWTYRGARPLAYRVSGLNALESASLIESLEIAVQEFDASFGPVAVVAK